MSTKKSFIVYGSTVEEAEGWRESINAEIEKLARGAHLLPPSWGADPFMFIAATLMLPARAILHFDDVSYLHQHLVMNLPATPPPVTKVHSHALNLDPGALPHLPPNALEKEIIAVT